MLIATAGHIDHGKTSLIRLLTDVDTDRLPQEKSRGVSIDLGFAYHTLGTDQVFGFVDVPGHEKFVRNMLAGVSAIDAAILVVAADDGPMPQTLEHLAILNLLGVKQGLVAITKTDRVDAGRVRQVQDQVAELLATTSLRQANSFPVSSVTGDGIDLLRKELTALRNRRPESPAGGRFRLPVDRQFTIQGAGLIVTGAVFSGSVKTGDELFLAPANLPVRVRSLHIQDKPADALTAGSAGDRCALNLVGLRSQSPSPVRGDWLVGAPPPESTQRIDATVTVLAAQARPLAHWTPIHLHHGASSLTGRIATLEGREISPGTTALAQLVLDQPTVVARGDRFIVRDQSASRTIAGGQVVDSYGASKGRARTERMTSLRSMQLASPTDALQQLAENNPAGVDLRHFNDAWNLTPAETEAVEQQVSLHRFEIRHRRFALTHERWRRLETLLLDALADRHQQNPDDPGPHPGELRRAARDAASGEIIDLCISQLVRQEKIVRRGLSLRLSSHQPGVTAQDENLWRQVEPLLPPEQTKPPVISALAAQLGFDKDELTSFLQRTANRGLLSRVAGNRYFHPRAVARLAGIAEQVAAENGGELGVKQYRDAAGIGRNLTIEVLEYFDALGLTRRLGDSRRIIGDRQELFGVLSSE